MRKTSLPWKEKCSNEKCSWLFKRRWKKNLERRKWKSIVNSLKIIEKNKDLGVSRSCVLKGRLTTKQEISVITKEECRRHQLSIKLFTITITRWTLLARTQAKVRISWDHRLNTIKVQEMSWIHLPLINKRRWPKIIKRSPCKVWCRVKQDMRAMDSVATTLDKKQIYKRRFSTYRTPK